MAGNFGPHAWLDLADFFAPGRCVAFASTSVYSEDARQVALRFFADSAFALWVDGRQVFIAPAAGMIAFDQHAVAVELRPGWNRIVFKLLRGEEGAWRLGRSSSKLHARSAFRCR